MRAFAVGALAVVVSCTPDDRPNSQTGVTVSGSVVDALYKTAIAGTEVCVLEPPGIPCVQTNPRGEFDITEVPKNTEILLQFLANNFYPNIAHYTIRESDEFLTYALASEDASALAASLANVTRDDTKGVIMFGARDGRGPEASNVPDVTLTLTPASGEGPFFFSTNGGIDREATRTTSLGGGSFFNVEPGDYILQYTHDRATCTPYYGWAGTQPGSLRVHIRAGYSTYTNQVCAEP